MRLQEWLQKENLSQRWLAEQLGVTDGRISQALKRLQMGHRLPYEWIPRILKLTNGKVKVEDEWPD